MNDMELIKKLPELEKRRWSFLETIGVAHRETIIANLLGYYFDPNENHGLNDTFIKALLQTVPKQLTKNKNVGIRPEIEELSKKGFAWANIILEDSTDENKRIDIVIETEEIVIAIEFKINHSLNNPLNDYVNYIEGHSTYNKKGKKPYYIVLTPKWKEPEGEQAIGNSEFVQIMLSHFIERVEEIIKEEDLFKDIVDFQQYILYKDFISTIENRKKTIKMIEEYFNQVKSNEITTETIEQTFKNINIVKGYIEKKAEELMKQLNKNAINKFFILPASKDKIESTIFCKGGENQTKIRFSLEGWSLELWGKVDGEFTQKSKIHIGNYNSSIIDLAEKING